MKQTIIHTLKTVLTIIVFPFALAAVVIFMLVTFAKMGAAALLRRVRISIR